MAITIRPYINATEANMLMSILTNPIYRHDKVAQGFVKKLSASGIPTPRATLEDKLGIGEAATQYNYQPQNLSEASIQESNSGLSLEAIEAIPETDLNALFGL